MKIEIDKAVELLEEVLSSKDSWTSDEIIHYYKKSMDELDNKIYFDRKEPTTKEEKLEYISTFGNHLAEDLCFYDEDNSIDKLYELMVYTEKRVSATDDEDDDNEDPFFYFFDEF